TGGGPDGYNAGEGAGDERFAGGVYVREAERRLARRDATGAADLEHVGARDPGEAVAAVGGQHLGRLVRAGDDEEVRRVARRHEAVRVEHQRLVGARGVRLDAGDDVVQLRVRVELRV